MAQAVSPEDAQNWLDAFNGGKGDGAAAPALEPAAAAMPEPAALSGAHPDPYSV